MRKGEQSDPGKGRESAKRQTSTAKKPSVKAEKAARKPGRPTDYRPEYAEQAKKLAVMGFDDEDVAFFFGVNLLDLALWAVRHPDFLAAMSPADEEIEAYRSKRRERAEKRNAWKRKAIAGSPSKRVENSTRARIYAALKGRGDGALFGRLGYSADALVAHIEAQFAPGMSWQNYGKWHIDHKKPVALFDQTEEAQFLECWALDNLQPLWALDNAKKGARYVGS